MNAAHARRRLTLIRFVPCVLVAIGPAAAAEPPPDAGKASAEVRDPGLASVLAKMDQNAAKIRDLTARFKEEKYTALLKKPLVSEGLVRIRGTRSLWEAETPHRAFTLIGPDEVRMYYPERATVEVYEIGTQLRFLALSPLPRLATLQEHFQISLLPLEQIAGPWDARTHVGLRLTPKSGSLREYIETVHVVLDRESSYVRRAVLIDADGDRTVLTFSDIRANTGLNDADMALVLPPGTKLVHPLSGTADQPAPEGEKP